MWERFEIQWTLYNMHMDGHVHIYCPHLTPYSPIYKLREMLSSRQLGETEKCSFEETFLKIQKYIHLSMDVTLDSPHPTPHTIHILIFSLLSNSFIGTWEHLYFILLSISPSIYNSTWSTVGLTVVRLTVSKLVKFVEFESFLTQPGLSFGPCGKAV